MNIAIISTLLTTVLGTLNTVLALLAVVPGAGAAIAPVQAAITSIMSALSILNGLPECNRSRQHHVRAIPSCSDIQN